VTLTLRTSGEHAVIEVVDTGPGIAANDKAQIFERFYRADSSRTRASGGSGLGLSIVHGIVAAHGGTVTVADTPGGGATFRVELPLMTKSLTAGLQPLPRDRSGSSVTLES
jgi:two-component system OmpR family sensor kinase